MAQDVNKEYFCLNQLDSYPTDTELLVKLSQAFLGSKLRKIDRATLIDQKGYEVICVAITWVTHRWWVNDRQEEKPIA